MMETNNALEGLQEVEMSDPTTKRSLGKSIKKRKIKKFKLKKVKQMAKENRMDLDH